MKTALIVLTIGLASCASIKPDNELLGERGYWIQTTKPATPEMGNTDARTFRQSLAKGGDKNGDDPFAGSGGTGDGGG